MSEKSQRSSAEYRERIIDDIINMRSGDPQFTPLFLAFSAEVCQICGDIGYLEGMALGKAHIHVKGTFEFVHGTCGGRSREESADILSRQRYRFCEFCRKQCERTKDNYFLRGWLCPQCTQGIEPKDPERGRDLINDIRRRRFLEPKSTEELRSLHISLTVQQFEWESDDPLQKLSLFEKLQLKATREKRLNALFRQLAAFHGIEESLLTGEVSSEDDESKNVIAKEGDIWTITFQGNDSRLRDMKGMKYIATLLEYPNRNFAATELVNLAEYQPRESSRQKQTRTRADALELGLRETTNLGDRGETADQKTLSQLKGRLAAIQKKKEEASELQDWESYAKLEEEEDQIQHYVNQAYGLGGKSRRSGSHADRVRSNVTRAIKRVLDKIRKQDQALAAYLKSTIKTGYQVSYTPDLNSPVSWNFNIS